VAKFALDNENPIQGENQSPRAACRSGCFRLRLSQRLLMQCSSGPRCTSLLLRPRRVSSPIVSRAATPCTQDMCLPPISRHLCLLSISSFIFAAVSKRSGSQKHSGSKTQL
jgi:hypothetical protein